MYHTANTSSHRIPPTQRTEDILVTLTDALANNMPLGSRYHSAILRCHPTGVRHGSGRSSAQSSISTRLKLQQDLSGFLSYYGAIADGNGASWSINGGPHVGIGGSHGNYETDSSPLHGGRFSVNPQSSIVFCWRLSESIRT